MARRRRVPARHGRGAADASARARNGTCPGCLRALDRYAYGCLEQTTSRALPLLYVDEVAALWQHRSRLQRRRKRSIGAIGHIVELQRSDGSFGVWSDTDDTVPWLDAYAADFLLRAKEHGNNVPDFAIKAAVGWLHDYVRQQHNDDKRPAGDWPMRITCWRAPRPTISAALRYFNDTQMARLPTQLAKAQLAAALAPMAMRPAPPPPMLRRCAAARRGRPLRYVDYGSDLRDSAAALAFAAADPGNQPRLTAVMDRIAELLRPGRAHQHPGAGLAADGGRGGGAS